MADVFAADRVIWVEGPTEELCFHHIYHKHNDALPAGTIFISVAAMGDFHSNRRDRSIVYEVYDRLSSAAAKLVLSVTFSFDTERLTDLEKEKMQRDSKGKLHFLPRRHLECYLLNPEAIAAFIIKSNPESAASVTPETVHDALKALSAVHPIHIPEWNGEITNIAWLARVDAASLIANVCGTLSN